MPNYTLYTLVDSWSFFCCTDYDVKAEDAVNFEDIDEDYDGPEVEATTEEDNVLSRKDYFSSNAVYASVNSTVSVFDEENYDEDDRMTNDIELHVKSVVQNCSSDGTEPNSKLFLCFSILAIIRFIATFLLPILDITPSFVSSIDQLKYSKAWHVSLLMYFTPGYACAAFSLG